MAPRLEDDRTPFGRALMERVAEDLQAGADVCEGHRDYCGHGLFHRNGKFILATVDSGDPYIILAEWSDKESFVAFFAMQSDYSCSGADPDSPLFYTTDEWDLGNQRLTRKRLQRLRQVSLP